MPVLPNLLERTILITLNRGPGPMMDLIGGIAFHALATAVKLGVFEAIGMDRLTTDEAAQRISADPRATGMLLDVLEAMGYVERKDGHYANTRMTVKWMLESSPNSLACMISGMQGALDRWKYLGDTIQEGRPPMLAWEWMDLHPGSWRDYQQIMIGMAHSCMEEIVSRVQIPPSAQRLIDLGGGHGLYSIGFCRNNPALSAVVFDWPSAREVACETIQSAGMEQRVRFQEGDLWRDDFGSGYDVALLFQVVHMYSPEQNIQLLKKAWQALAPGGRVVINDQVAIEATGSLARVMARLEGLELLNSVNGRTYPPKEIERWLVEAGFTQPSSMLLRNTPGLGVVVGIRPAG